MGEKLILSAESLLTSSLRWKKYLVCGVITHAQMYLTQIEFQQCCSTGFILSHTMAKESMMDMAQPVNAQLDFIYLAVCRQHSPHKYEFQLSLIFAANHYVDNEEEAVSFLNSGKLKHTKAFLMKMTMLDEETDVTGLTGSSNFFEYRYL